MMEFNCFDLENYGSDIGKCTLPGNQYDPVGTEHMFGDVVYVLVETKIDARPSMYFRRKHKRCEVIGCERTDEAILGKHYVCGRHYNEWYHEGNGNEWFERNIRQQKEYKELKYEKVLREILTYDAYSWAIDRSFIDSRIKEVLNDGSEPL